MTTSGRQPAEQARSALLHATLIASTIEAALVALDLGLGGFPSSVPGAGPPGPARECHVSGCTHESLPCVLHGDTADVGVSVTVHGLLDPRSALVAEGHRPTTKSTIVERGALQGDRARAELEQLRTSLNEAGHHLARAAGITYRWGLANVDVSTIKARLVSIDEGIWCQHCSMFGRHEPRMGGGSVYCQWCAAFQQRYKHLPPEEIWDARDARGGRIDVVTINRIMGRVRAARKAAAKMAKLESAS